MAAPLNFGGNHERAGAVAHFAGAMLCVLVGGAILRAALITITPGEFYDTAAIARVGQVFLHTPLHLYQLDVNPGSYQGSPTYPWPYLPGFLPLAAVLRWLSDEVGASVNDLDRTLMSGVDLLLAWVVQWCLGRWGRSDRERLIAAALIAFGPAFAAISAVHGQIDALAWLPAVAAVGLWQAPQRMRRRGLVCGALLGLGIAIKTTPALALVALVLSARSRREIAELCLAALGVAALSALPFALSSPEGLAAIVNYRGFAGRAGLTALLQPRLALHQLAGVDVRYDPSTIFLLDHAGLVLAAVLAPAAARAWFSRLTAAKATVALLLAFYVAAPAILPQYWLWIVPFLILGGFPRAALAYQLALLPLLIATYAFLQEPNQPHRQLSEGLILYGYVPWLWLVTVAMSAGAIAVLAPRRPR